MHEEGINDDGEWLECVCGGGRNGKSDSWAVSAVEVRSNLKSVKFTNS